MFICFFFFKQKTAYEMRISDWSSTCALPILEKLAALDDGKARTIQHVADAILHHVFQFTAQNPEMDRVALAAYGAELVALGNGLSQRIEIGRASCRERVCQYV